MIFKVYFHLSKYKKIYTSAAGPQQYILTIKVY